MNKRTDTEILKDLVEAVQEYNSLRDDEWDFKEKMVTGILGMKGLTILTKNF